MAAHDAGVQVACPGCGEIVLLKAMIPLLGVDGQGVRYLCPPCARALMSPIGTQEEPGVAAAVGVAPPVEAAPPVGVDATGAAASE